MLPKIKLTKTQEEKLLKIKNKHKSAIIRDRAHAVLLRSKGLTLKNTMQALFRSKGFINQAVKKFNNGELDQINFSSNNRKISKENREKLVDLIRTKTPKDLKDFKFREEFWTTDILKTVIKKRHKVEYKSEDSYYNLFKAAGFSFHKPKTKDFRQDDKKVKDFKGALKKSSTTTKIRLSW